MKNSMFTEYILKHYDEDVSVPQTEWRIEDGLANKVTQDGRFREFFGATSVIPISANDCVKCRLLQVHLITAAKGLVPVDSSTFHVTVHSFANMNNVSSDKQEVEQAVARTEPDVRDAFTEIQQQYGSSRIRMKALGVKTTWREAVSLQFVPVGEEDSVVLSNIFAQLEDVYPLKKPFLPHVTLAYLEARPYREDEIAVLTQAIQSVNRMAMPEIELQVSDLVYQYHLDMNHYRTVFGLLDA